MATYTITIKMDNAAFMNDFEDLNEGVEIAIILRALAAYNDGHLQAQATTLRDANGNVVGKAERTT